MRIANAGHGRRGRWTRWPDVAGGGPPGGITASCATSGRWWATSATADPGNDLAVPLLCHDTTVTALSARGGVERSRSPTCSPARTSLRSTRTSSSWNSPSRSPRLASVLTGRSSGGRRPSGRVVAALQVAPLTADRGTGRPRWCGRGPLSGCRPWSRRCGRPVDAAAAAGRRRRSPRSPELVVLGADEEE
ncbi:hypothetical protein HBB16_20245 [Pseudonocardia sp. MCCB 268]|nr:hypothetical protein [Pseudonocardia cytotoxica]